LPEPSCHCLLLPAPPMLPHMMFHPCLPYSRPLPAIFCRHFHHFFHRASHVEKRQRLRAPIFISYCSLLPPSHLPPFCPYAHIRLPILTLIHLFQRYPCPIYALRLPIMIDVFHDDTCSFHVYRYYLHIHSYTDIRFFTHSLCCCCCSSFSLFHYFVSCHAFIVRLMPSPPFFPVMPSYAVCLSLLPLCLFSPSFCNASGDRPPCPPRLLSLRFYVADHLPLTPDQRPDLHY